MKRDSAQVGWLHLPSPGSAVCLDAARYLDLRAVGRLAGALARRRPQAVVAANPFADELCPLYRDLCARATNQRIARV